MNHNYFLIIIILLLNNLNTDAQTINLPDCSNCVSVNSLDCGSAILSPAYYLSGEEYSGSLTIPYSGGNGGAIQGDTFSSSGVTGLTATLIAGELANGAGNIDLFVTGTPSGSGTVSFDITFGGQTCTVTTDLTEDNSSGPDLLSGGSGACNLGDDFGDIIINYVARGNQPVFAPHQFIINGKYIQGPKSDNHQVSFNRENCLGPYEPVEHLNFIDADVSRKDLGNGIDDFGALLTDQGQVLITRSDNISTTNSFGCGDINVFKTNYNSGDGWNTNTPLTFQLGTSNAKPIRLWSSRMGLLFYGDDGNYYGYGVNAGQLGTNDLKIGTHSTVTYYQAETTCNGALTATLVQENQPYAWDGFKPHPDSLLLSADFAVWVKNNTIHFRGRYHDGYFPNNIIRSLYSDWCDINTVQHLDMPSGVSIKQFTVVKAENYFVSNPKNYPGASNVQVTGELLFVLGDDGNMYFYILEGGITNRGAITELQVYPAQWANGANIVSHPLNQGSLTGDANPSLVSNFFPSGIAEIMNLRGKVTDIFMRIASVSGQKLSSSWSIMPWVLRLNNGDVVFLNDIDSSHGANAGWTDGTLSTVFSPSEITIDNSTLHTMIVFKQAFFDANFKQFFRVTISPTIGHNHIRNPYFAITQDNELWFARDRNVEGNDFGYDAIDSVLSEDSSPGASTARATELLGEMLSLYPLRCCSGIAEEVYQWKN